jgi:hypothetical protein
MASVRFVVMLMGVFPNWTSLPITPASFYDKSLNLQIIFRSILICSGVGASH